MKITMKKYILLMLLIITANSIQTSENLPKFQIGERAPNALRTLSDDIPAQNERDQHRKIEEQNNLTLAELWLSKNPREFLDSHSAQDVRNFQGVLSETIIKYEKWKFIFTSLIMALFFIDYRCMNDKKPPRTLISEIMMAGAWYLTAKTINFMNQSEDLVKQALDMKHIMENSGDLIIEDFPLYQRILNRYEHPMAVTMPEEKDCGSIMDSEL